MIAASCGGHARAIGPRFHEPIDESDSAPGLECSGRKVVLMLDPDLGSRGFGQKRPLDLRRRLQFAVDQVRRRFDFGYAEHEFSVPKCLRHFK